MQPRGRGEGSLEEIEHLAVRAEKDKVERGCNAVSDSWDKGPFELTLSEGSPVGGASLFDGRARHFSAREDAVFGGMVVALTIRTERFRAALTRVESERGRLIS